MGRIKKYIKRCIKNIYFKKIPVPYPVYEGKLLSGRVALITGGSSGIGYAIAECFIKNDASVIIVGRNKLKLEEAKERLKKLVKGNNEVYSFEMNVADAKKLKDNFNKIIKSIGDKKIDILVNNAGINKGKNIGETELDDFQDVVDTNIIGTYFLSQIVFNYMKECKIKGNILNVASSSSIRPAANPYAISKWGINGLTLGMAKKFIKYDIVVNGIAPGPTVTPMIVDNQKYGVGKITSPIGRYIIPEEIANIALILVSEVGKCIVGDTIYATGGAGILTLDDLEY